MLEALIAVISLTLLNIALAIYNYGRLVSRVEALGNHLTHLDEEMSKMRVEITAEIKNIYTRINDIDRRLSRLEGKVE